MLWCCLLSVTSSNTTTLWLVVCWSGDIQIGMVYRKERLDVEVIRARGLVGKQGNKNTPGENTIYDITAGFTCSHCS